MNCNLLNFKFDTNMISNFYFYFNFQTVFFKKKIDFKFYLNFPLLLKPYNWKLHKHTHMCTHFITRLQNHIFKG